MTEIAELVESDVALAIAVLRSANNGGGPRGRVASVPDAVEVLTPAGIRAVAAITADLRLLRAPRLRGRASRSASASTPSRPTTPPRTSPASPTSPDRDELATAALLHDIGQLVLIHALPRLRGDPRRPHHDARGSAPRSSAASSASTTRWSAASSPAAGACRRSIAGAIERHHSDDADGPPPRSGSATCVAHYAAGDTVSPDAMVAQRRCLRAQRGAAASARLRVSARPGAPAAARRALPAVATRARRPPRPRRGQGLQADRRGAGPLGEHRAHPPAQRLRQDRRRRPRPGRPDRPRARLDLSGPAALRISASSAGSRPKAATPPFFP